MKKLFLLLLVSLTALTLFNGCSSGVERIGVQVDLVKLEKQANGSLTASLRFSNPNVGPINLLKSTHQLTLDGKPAGTIIISEPVGVPAQNTATVPVVFTPAGGLAAISGSVSYQLSSLLILSIYDDDTEKFKTSSAGTVTVQ